jgi:hypothetical protein
MSPKKKMKRMNQINRHNSKQTHGGCYPTLGSEEYSIINGVPEERIIVKCNIYMTAPVHLAVSCFFFSGQKLSNCW